MNTEIYEKSRVTDNTIDSLKYKQTKYELRINRNGRKNNSKKIVKN